VFERFRAYANTSPIIGSLEALSPYQAQHSQVHLIPSTAVICCYSRVRGTGVGWNLPRGMEEGPVPVVAFGETAVKGGAGAVEGSLGTAIGVACFC
jgi:hypothetical protein